MLEQKAEIIRLHYPCTGKRGISAKPLPMPSVTPSDILGNNNNSSEEFKEPQTEEEIQEELGEAEKEVEEVSPGMPPGALPETPLKQTHASNQLIES